MVDTNALERQLAEESLRIVGPARPVDDLAIYEAVTATSRSHRWGSDMFSAVRFVVATVIVALFGGFLLAGVRLTPQEGEVVPAAVTESPSPMTTETLLSGMVTEEGEPGVFHVINDGVLDVASFGASDVVAGYDGSIWLLRDDDFVRLGSDGSHAFPGEYLFGDGRLLEVGPDGTMWVIALRFPLISDTRGGDALRSADGEAWLRQPCPKDCTGITVAPDGTVWASWTDGDGAWRVSSLGPDGVGRLLDGSIPNEFSPGGFSHLFSADSGDLYGIAEGWGRTLYHYDDGTWSRVRDLPMDAIIDVGRDGTVWQSGLAYRQSGFARLAGGEWTESTSADLLDLDLRTTTDHDEFGVAPDGSLWLSARCDGLVRFNGMSTDHFLPGRCVSMDIAADGSVWALAEGQEGEGLYVITPEAFAASYVQPGQQKEG